MLVAAVALHGALLAAGWSLHARPPETQTAEPVPLQVMLISERTGTGDSLTAVAQPAGDMGQPAPLPPPTAEPAAVQEVRQPDRPALPVTAPDFTPLAAVPVPTGPIRLRLHIDAVGRVDRVEVLDSDPGDAAFVERLVAILLATPHIPARRDGQDVASVKEVSLDFAPAR
jgi:hypothetical protein